MSELRPQPFAVLLARALAEYEVQGSIFDLPKRSFWHAREGLDLSVMLPSGRAATPLGPAAGPHTQLAQNLAIAWLAGSRVLELKTVQIQDRIEVAKPSIAAVPLGTNVEWSQELRLEESAEQYTAGWFLIHALRAHAIAGAAGDGETRFEASVGYDLAGVRSAPVARFLDAMTDAAPLLARMRGALPPGLRAAADVEVPARMVRGVTLSTMHGCPADEIERIVEHLLERHRLDVNVKLNPTLFGYDETDALLRGALGYEEIRVDRAAFDGDLQWDEALAMFERLGRTAARHGLTVGAKLINTLAVRNLSRVLEGETIYLSGTALHPLAIRLAHRVVEATGGRVPISFSAGVDAENFADAVACGLRPVTVSSDLLKPTGYRRLPRFLKALEAEMERTGSHTLDEFILARAGKAPGAAGPVPAGADAAGGAERLPAAPPPDPARVRAAIEKNLAAYADRVTADERYHAPANRTPPARSGARLALFDCESCNACLLVCPNDAFFSLPIGPLALEAPDLKVVAGAVVVLPARLELRAERQWAYFADFCNDCGNCDTFCPEQGGPYQAKPRFHGSRAGFVADAPRDAFLIEDTGAVTRARFAGIEHVLTRTENGARFGDGAIEVELDAAHRVVSTRVSGAHEGHTLPLARYHAMRLLRDAVLARVNPVSAQFMPALREE